MHHGLQKDNVNHLQKTNSRPRQTQKLIVYSIMINMADT